MPHVEFDIDTELPPERVMGALLDFSDRRPSLWPGLNPKEYRVISIGDTMADIREGNSDSIWAVERYDWSKRAEVTWWVKDSSFSTSDSYVTAQFRYMGGGSRIHVIWDGAARA